MSVPVLETERLILRGHRPEDFPAFAAMWAHPAVTRFIGGKPLSEEEAWAKFMRSFGHWELMGFGFWAIVEKESGSRIGETGFLDVRRAIIPPFHGTPEVGWGLLPAVHGKGYASEAVRAVLDWGDAHFGRGKRICIIAPENMPSIRLAEKLGFREKTRTTYHDESTIIFELDTRGEG